MKLVALISILFTTATYASTEWSGYKARLKNDLGTMEYEVRLVEKQPRANMVALQVVTSERKDVAHAFQVNFADFEKAQNIFHNCEVLKLGKMETVKVKAGKFKACRVKTVTDDLFLEHTAWYIENLWVPVKSIYRYDRQRKLGQVQEVIALF